MASQKTDLLARIVLLLILALLAALWCSALWNYFHLARVALPFPYTLDYGEGPLLDQVARLAAGENIYHASFATSPYTISNYPPVYLLAQVPFYWAAGPAFWYGRLISLASALLAALFLGLTLHALTRDRLGALVGGGLLLAYPYIQFWSLLDRIDLLALALSWAGIFVLVRSLPRRWGVPVAGLLLTAAIFTRQSYALAAPGAAFLWLLLTRRARQAFKLALITGGSSLALFLILNIFTSGGFYRNIVSANVNPFYWETVRYYMDEMLSNSRLILALIAVLLFTGFVPGHRSLWALAVPYLALGALSAVTIGKDGSNINYLLELTAALAFGTGAAIARVRSQPWIRVAFLLLLAVQVYAMNAWTRDGFNDRITGKTNQQMHLYRLYELVKKTDGIVLADEDMGLVPLAGKPLYYQPFEYKMLADGGLWDQEAFLKEIREKRFSLILQYDPDFWPAVEARWTPAMRSAIPDNYRLEKWIGDTRVYRPRE